MAKKEGKKEETQARKGSLWKRMMLAAFIVGGIFILTASMLIFAWLKVKNVSMPFTYVGTEKVGGLPSDKLRERIDEIAQDFAVRKIAFVWDDRVEHITVAELGFSFDVPSTMRRVPLSGSQNNIMFVISALKRERLEPVLEFDRFAFERRFAAYIPDIPRMRNAGFARNAEGAIEIIPERAGYALQLHEIRDAVREKLLRLDYRAVNVAAVHEAPTVTAAELEAARGALLAELEDKAISVRYEGERWSFVPAQHLEFVRFEKSAQGGIDWAIDSFPLEKLIDEQLVPKIAREEAGVKIDKDENGRIVFEGQPKAGYSVDRKQLIAGVYFAFENGIDSVEIPVHELPPPVVISEELQEMGIREIIGHGYSTFYGSPANRVHNIGVGISRYNGLIVPPDSIFSFNANLGEVDESTGYRKELVIKNEGTIPEFGGGLCQVSTTMYRAIINSGLPVVERSPHSYAVTYYSQVGGHGLDATIYPGVKDLKFKNDSPGHILVQSYRDGSEAHYYFYGTSDGREVELEGPYITNRTSAPAEAIEFLVDNLEPGQREQVQKPVNGFDATWYRIVRKGGEEYKETIFSDYHAMPAKYRVGIEKEDAPEGEVLN